MKIEMADCSSNSRGRQPRTTANTTDQFSSINSVKLSLSPFPYLVAFDSRRTATTLESMGRKTPQISGTGGPIVMKFVDADPLDDTQGRPQKNPAEKRFV